jgi:hypothetical protein
MLKGGKTIGLVEINAPTLLGLKPKQSHNENGAGESVLYSPLVTS